MLVALAVGACYNYPSAAINNTNYHVVAANPVVGFIAKPGDSLQVFLRLTNDADNAAVTSWTITNPNPAGIEVHYDATYRRIYINDSTAVPETDKNQQRYFVLAKAPGVYTFSATPTSVNTGVSGTIKIRVQPGDLGAALKQLIRLNNQPDTIVAPQYVKFPSTVTLTLNTVGGVTRTVASGSITVTPDSTMLIFTPAIGDNGVVTVNGAMFDAPGVDPAYRIATLKTTNALAPTQPAVLPNGIGQTSRTNGQVDSLVIPAGVKVTPQSTVIINKAAGGTRTLTFATYTPPAVGVLVPLTPAAGTFQIAPTGTVYFAAASGDTGPITITTIIFDFPGIDPNYRIASVVTTNSLTTVP